MRIWMTLLLTFFYLKALAYPDFIGYGYRSCTVCHFSAAGGGGLTDYGRALFATEIASKPLWFQVSDETLGEYSKFLGKTSFPWWMRLGYKYRALTIESDPGGPNESHRYFNMQNDLNSVFFFDKKQTVSLIATLGYTESSLAIYPNEPMASDQYLFWREYYSKYSISREYHVYAGLMDKTFGLRHPDHTANNRVRIGLGQNDQVHGVMFHRAQPDTDFFAHLWVGNLQASQELRASGGSLMFEKVLTSQTAIGAELLSENGDSIKRNLVAVHSKVGMQEGNSFLAELGYAQQTLLASPQVDSIYLFSQGHIKLVRGLFIESTGQYTKEDVTSVSENFQWTLGFLWFPMQRIELRASARQNKTLNVQPVRNDTWYYLTQIHLSL